MSPTLYLVRISNDFTTLKPKKGGWGGRGWGGGNFLLPLLYVQTFVDKSAAAVFVCTRLLCHATCCRCRRASPSLPVLLQQHPILSHVRSLDHYHAVVECAHLARGFPDHATWMAGWVHTAWLTVRLHAKMCRYIILPSPQLAAPPQSSRSGVRTFILLRLGVPRATPGGGACGFAPTAGLLLPPSKRRRFSGILRQRQHSLRPILRPVLHVRRRWALAAAVVPPFLRALSQSLMVQLSL